MSGKGKRRPAFPRTRCSSFPSAWWCSCGVTATPLPSGRWLLMQSFESGWVAVSRTTRPLKGNRVQVRSALDREVFKMLQNKRPAAVGGDSVEAAEDADFMGLYPMLWMFLTSTKWADGEARQVSSVSYWLQHGKWTACIVEKNWGMILFATADKWEDLREALDARLSDPKADWRLDRKTAGQQAKRVQRPS